MILKKIKINGKTCYAVPCGYKLSVYGFVENGSFSELFSVLFEDPELASAIANDLKKYSKDNLQYN
jgi:hypothetical protein